MNVSMNKNCGGCKGKKGQSGFTLLELLIVISIIAILSVALVFILNPAETLKKSRDAQRIADLNTLKTALGFYLTSTTTANLNIAGAEACNSTISSGRSSTSTVVALVDGTGWLKVNLTTLTGGSPISNLPLDPTNSGIYGYTYRCSTDGSKFEISAAMESDAYKPGGIDDKAAKDGGNDASRYEVGTDLTIDTIKTS